MTLTSLRLLFFKPTEFFRSVHLQRSDEIAAAIANLSALPLKIAGRKDLFSSP
jgi:hypothetical protein